MIVGESTHSTIREIASAQVLVQVATNLAGSANIPVQTTISGIAGGTIYYFRVLATNAGGTSFGGLRSFGNSFASWQNANFGANASDPLIAGPLANPANDGISNLLKYAFNLDPSIPATSGLPVVASDAGFLTLTYTKNLTASDLVFAAEWSPNLENWSPTGVVEEVLSENGPTQQVRVSIPMVPGNAGFLRLQVTQQP